MKENLKSISPRSKAFLQLGGVLVGGALLFGGCSYALNNSRQVNEYMVSRNPAMYISSVADFLATNPGESGQYQAEISDLTRSVNALPSLSAEDRLYLFESNASLVDAGKAASVCESSVVGRLDEKARLEYVLSTVDNTENKYYFRIVGRMLQNVGEDAYSSIASLFGK